MRPQANPRDGLLAALGQAPAGGGRALAALLMALTFGGSLIIVPATALAQGTSPFSPGLTQSGTNTAAPTTSIPSVTAVPTTTTGGGGLSGGAAVAIGIGALVVLGGISLFIWSDARRRAPVRSGAGAGAEGARSATKSRPRPRKLSPAERRRRKRGRAR